MSHLRRFCIMLKRPLRQPVFLMMLAFLLFMTYLASRVPENRRSTSIPVAILNKDHSRDGEALIQSLLTEESLFTFYLVKDEESMYRDLSSGKANTGYIIPESFMAEAARFHQDIRIDQILTEGSLLPTISMDVIFSAVFRIEASTIMLRELEGKDLLPPGSASDYAAGKVSDRVAAVLTLYTNYRQSGEIFRVTDISGQVYSHEIGHSRSDIPVRKLCGFFLLAAGLLGLISYLSDKENQLYMRFTRGEHAAMKLMHIESSLLIPALVSFPAILLTEGGSPLSLLLRLVFYIAAVTLFVWLLSLIIHKSSTLTRVLPLYLLLTLLLGGIFYDLGPYNPVLKIVSGLFLPYYF